MATVVAFQGVSEPVNTLFDSIAMFRDRIPFGDHDSEEFAVTDPPDTGYIYGFAGTGFGSYDSHGFPHTGTITAIGFFTPDGILYMGVADISIPVSQILPYMNSGGPSPADFRNLVLGGDDFISGSNGADTLYGFGGDDLIYGGLDSDLDVADLIHGGDGNDIIDGYSGADQIYGDAGDDIIQIYASEMGSGELADGGTGVDTLLAVGNIVDFTGATLTSFERLVLDIGFNSEVYIAAIFQSNQIGGGLSSTLEVTGTDLTDIVTVMSTSAGSSVDLSGWTFVNWTPDQDDRVEIIGKTGNESLTGTYLTDYITGGAGNDTINGGDGLDVAIYMDAVSGVHVTIGAAGPQAIGGGQGSDTLISIEGVVGSDWADEIYGDAGGNLIYGGYGADLMVGGGGDDLLYGDLDADTLTGGDGNDLLDGGVDADTMTGGAGDDIYYVDNAGDQVTEAVSGGDDTIITKVSYSLEGQTGIETLILADSYLSTTGNDEDNVLIGFAGSASNSLNGGKGADTMIGGGVDHYVVDNVGDVIIDDSLAYEDSVGAYISWSLEGTNLGRIYLLGDDDINATGNDMPNVVSGNDGDNILDGRGGNDSMAGYRGDDTYYIDNVDDSIFETDGLDTIITSIDYVVDEYTYIENIQLVGGAVNVRGNDLNNVITGNAAANVIDGWYGNDTLIGGLGADTMIGGEGNDVFYVENAGDVVVEGDPATWPFPDTGDTVYSSVTWTMTAGSKIEFLILTGSGALNAIGNSVDNTITGNIAANTLNGGDGADILNGGGGIDTLLGAAGNDNLNGGVGADIMKGGAGDDIYTLDQAGDAVTEGANQGLDTVRTSFSYTLVNNLENLVLTGSAAIDATGNAYDNRLTGNGAANVLNGGLGNDTLLGGDGADTLNGGAGIDIMSGGEGDDIYYVDVAGDRVIEGWVPGMDTVRTAVSWTAGGYVENVELTGTASINAYGNIENNTLTGNSGNNILDGKYGADTMIGGAGDDTYYVETNLDVVIEDVGGGIDKVRSVFYATTLADGVEKLDLIGGMATEGYGNALDNEITGNALSNKIDGGGGADIMRGNGGNDSYIVDNIGDVLIESATGGAMDIVAASATFTLGSNVEHLFLTGTADINATGNGLNNMVEGNSGANIINGKAGADQMKGYSGDDIYYVDNVGDTVSGEWGGHDTIRSTISWTADDEVEDLQLLGTANINATGNYMDNRLTGNSGNNILNGDVGVDTMLGGGGDDIYYVDSIGERTIDNGGVDTVRASIAWTIENNIENLELTGASLINGKGNALNNTITGNLAANTLEGLAGSDTLNGGMGQDTLIGGADADIFLFNTAVGSSNVDTIADFTLGADKVELENAIFQGIGGAGGLTANRFVVGSAALDANDFIIYNPTTGALSYDADGNGAGSAVQFAFIATGLALTASDFLVI